MVKVGNTQLLFERLGGGNLIFHASATSSDDTVQVIVTQMAYRDTNIQRTITRNSNNSGLFDTLVEALSGTMNIAGSFKQDTTAIVGTWAYVYMENGNGKMEVTNCTLRSTLLALEPIVVATL